MGTIFWFSSLGIFTECKMNGCRLLLVAGLLAIQWAFPSESVPFVIPDYGRWIIPTVGRVWPQPQQQTSSQNFFVLRPNTFQFQVISVTAHFSLIVSCFKCLCYKVVGEKCDIIDEAIRRYYEIIFYPGGLARSPPSTPAIPVESHPQFRAFLDSVAIDLKFPCETLPTADMIERCTFLIFYLNSFTNK